MLPTVSWSIEEDGGGDIVDTAIDETWYTVAPGCPGPPLELAPDSRPWTTVCSREVAGPPQSRRQSCDPAAGCPYGQAQQVCRNMGQAAWPRLDGAGSNTPRPRPVSPFSARIRKKRSSRLPPLVTREISMGVRASLAPQHAAHYRIEQVAGKLKRRCGNNRGIRQKPASRRAWSRMIPGQRVPQESEPPIDTAWRGRRSLAGPGGQSIPSAGHPRHQHKAPVGTAISKIGRRGITC